MMKKSILIGCLMLLFLLFPISIIHALQFPWLDYGGLLYIDTVNGNVTNTAVRVSSVTIDGIYDTTTDNILKSDVWVDNIFNISNFYIGSFDTSNPMPYLSADVVKVTTTWGGYGYILSLGNINIDNSINSQFLDEFSQVISNITSPITAVTMGVAWNYGDKINVMGKLAPVPEPGTILLLGSGMMGIAYYIRRKKRG